MYSECVCNLSYPACDVHAPYCVVIRDLSCPAVFSHIISQTVRNFEKKKKLLNIKRII
jgi:hypothetical protein